MSFCFCDVRRKYAHLVFLCHHRFDTFSKRLKSCAFADFELFAQILMRKWAIPIAVQAVPNTASEISIGSVGGIPGSASLLPLPSGFVSPTILPASTPLLTTSYSNPSTNTNTVVSISPVPPTLGTPLPSIPSAGDLHAIEEATPPRMSTVDEEHSAPLSGHGGVTDTTDPTTSAQNTPNLDGRGLPVMTRNVSSSGAPNSAMSPSSPNLILSSISTVPPGNLELVRSGSTESLDSLTEPTRPSVSPMLTSPVRQQPSAAAAATIQHSILMGEIVEEDEDTWVGDEIDTQFVAAVSTTLNPFCISQHFFCLV